MSGTLKVSSAIVSVVQKCAALKVLVKKPQVTVFGSTLRIAVVVQTPNGKCMSLVTTSIGLHGKTGIACKTTTPPKSLSFIRQRARCLF